MNVLFQNFSDETITRGLHQGTLSLGLLGAVVGLLVGSHLATLLVRWPEGRSAMAGRSVCDGCQKTLRWWELVPIAAWVIQTGRCRRCGSSIAWQHLVLEGLCGASGGYFASTGFPLLAPFCWLLITLALFDALYLWLPDRLILALSIAALLAPGWNDQIEAWGRILGGLCGFGTLWLLRIAYAQLRGREGLGGGDAKLFGALGLWFGPFALPQVMLFACIIGLTDAIVRLRGRTDTGLVQLPLGTYLTISSVAFVLEMPLK